MIFFSWILSLNVNIFFAYYSYSMVDNKSETLTKKVICEDKQNGTYAVHLFNIIFFILDSFFAIHFIREVLLLYFQHRCDFSELLICTAMCK